MVGVGRNKRMGRSGDDTQMSGDLTRSLHSTRREVAGESERNELLVFAPPRRCSCRRRVPAQAWAPADREHKAPGRRGRGMYKVLLGGVQGTR